MKELRKFICPAAALALVSALVPPAHASSWQTYLEVPDVGNDRFTVLALMALVLLAMFIALAVTVHLGKNGRISVSWAVLGVLFSSLALLLSIIGSFSGSLYSRPAGDPSETVRQFFDAILAEDYDSAYSCLSNYDGLGLENAPDTETGLMVYEALKESYDYALSGQPRLDRLSAVQSVRFRYLEIADMENSLHDNTERNLQNAVKELPVDQIYDENDQFLPEVANKAYTDALRSVLGNAGAYYRSAALEIKLEYINGQWLILCEQPLLDVLTGGTF